jgi:hypothetical protein
VKPFDSELALEVLCMLAACFVHDGILQVPVIEVDKRMDVELYRTYISPIPNIRKIVFVPENIDC